VVLIALIVLQEVEMLRRLGLICLLSLSIFGCKEKNLESVDISAERGEPTPVAPIPEPEIAPESTADDIKAEASPPVAHPLVVTWESTPAVLEVMQDNRVKLFARLSGGTPATCRWEFEGELEPAEGCELSRVFPEARADVHFKLSVVDADSSREISTAGYLPLERLAGEEKTPLPERHDDSGLPPSKKTPAPEAGKNTRVQWSLEPPELEVMRDTLVRLEAVPAPELGSDVICKWDPGDDSPSITGCKVEHLFRGGMADRIVSLQLLSGDKILLRETTVLRYERLPTGPSPAAQSEGDEDPVPGCTRDCRRIAVASITGERGLSRAERLAVDHHASLLVLFLRGGALPPGKLNALAERLGGKSISILPVSCDGSEGSIANLLLSQGAKGSFVPHSPPSDLPGRYAAQWQSVYLMASAKPGAKSLDDEKWMADQLEVGSVFPSRILFTCKSLDRLTGQESALIASPYRAYEKMLRGNLSLLITAGSPVFYRGMYGILKTVAPGLLDGRPAGLMGSDNPQPPSASLIDLSAGKILRVIGVLSGGNSWAPFPDAALPRKVGVFIRW
jgi:hypothetical protein